MLIKVLFFTLLSFSLQGQKYLFNNKKDTVFFSNYVNEFFVKQGTPLCFDGTVKIYPTDKKNKYLIEVLDTVTRVEGLLNVAAYVETPEGGTEKIFIDKFSFIIKKSPEPLLYIGKATSKEIVDTANLALSIGFAEKWPKANFQITESIISLDKNEAISIKSNQLNQTVIRKIKKLCGGSEFQISVVYKDPLLRAKRISGVFYL